MSQPPYPHEPQPAHPGPYGQPPQPRGSERYPSQPYAPWPYPPPPYPPTALQQPYPPVPVYRVYRSGRGLAIAALVLAGLLTLVEVVEAILAWSAGRTYVQAARDGVPVETIFTAYDFSTVIWLLAVVPAYIVSCLWLWRARANAEVLSASPHKRSRGWVWAGWLVPVVSLWFPYQVVRDVWRATETRWTQALLGWWWAAWLLDGAMTQVGSSLTPVAGQAAEGPASALGPVESVSALVAVVAFALWCQVVLRIVREQEAAAARY